MKRLSRMTAAEANDIDVPDTDGGTVTDGDEVSNGKPDPEPYLAAAAAVGVDPAACVAIEDSPTGVAAALAAGCATLGVPHVVPVAAAPGLTLVDSLVGIGLADLRRLHTV